MRKTKLKLTEIESWIVNALAFIIYVGTGYVISTYFHSQDLTFFFGMFWCSLLYSITGNRTGRKWSRRDHIATEAMQALIIHEHSSERNGSAAVTITEICESAYMYADCMSRVRDEAD